MRTASEVARRLDARASPLEDRPAVRVARFLAERAFRAFVTLAIVCLLVLLSMHSGALATPSFICP